MEKLAIRVLRQGKIPRHVAFIMDGNRRFAKNEKKGSLSGHVEGTKTLKKCLLYCLELGVKSTSFYAFSI
jgi:ditrans,polycis-polyprenyl diphosphate synthase